MALRAIKTLYNGKYTILIRIINSNTHCIMNANYYSFFVWYKLIGASLNKPNIYQVAERFALNTKLYIYTCIYIKCWCGTYSVNAQNFKNFKLKQSCQQLIYSCQNWLINLFFYNKPTTTKFSKAMCVSLCESYGSKIWLF